MGHYICNLHTIGLKHISVLDKNFFKSTCYTKDSIQSITYLHVDMNQTQIDLKHSRGQNIQSILYANSRNVSQNTRQSLRHVIRMITGTPFSHLMRCQEMKMLFWTEGIISLKMFKHYNCRKIGGYKTLCLQLKSKMQPWTHKIKNTFAE